MKKIRIGTRKSALALWQAHRLVELLEADGFETELVKLSAAGDKDLTRPLHRIGITGLFTKTLDDAMLRGEIDLAVHSFKDVPTILEKGISQFAVLERGPKEDVLVYRNSTDFLQTAGKVATGSLRRRAQWQNRYPEHELTGLRGNMQTRLSKIEEEQLDAAIFAKAGLERIGLLSDNHIVLDWMISAPAQGAIMITGREEDAELRKICDAYNHKNTAICCAVERDFMRTLEGGCTAPIGASATLEGPSFHFKAGLFSLDGAKEIIWEDQLKFEEVGQISAIGEMAARHVLQNGGSEIMEEIAKSLG